MRNPLVTALLATLAIGLPVNARAVEPGPDAEARLMQLSRIAVCPELSDLVGPGGAEMPLQRIEPLPDSDGAQVLHVVGKQSRYLVFLRNEPSSGEGDADPTRRACESFRIGRAAGRTFGRFLGAGQTKAFALTSTKCTSEYCPVAVAVRGSAERPLAAVRTPAHCDNAALLKTVRLFDGRDGLQLTCRSSAGAGYNEELLLIQAVPPAQALSVVHRSRSGAYEALSASEKRAGRCAAKPVGWVKVAKIGSAQVPPVIRVLEWRDADLVGNGKGSSTVYDWAYDAKGGRFVHGDSGGVATPFDTYAGCKPRK